MDIPHQTRDIRASLRRWPNIASTMDQYVLRVAWGYAAMHMNSIKNVTKHIKRAIYDPLGRITRPIFSSDTHISTTHSVYTSILHELTAAILNIE